MAKITNFNFLAYWQWQTRWKIHLSLFVPMNADVNRKNQIDGNGSEMTSLHFMFLFRNANSHIDWNKIKISKTHIILANTSGLRAAIIQVAIIRKIEVNKLYCVDFRVGNLIKTRLMRFIVIILFSLFCCPVTHSVPDRPPDSFELK